MRISFYTLLFLTISSAAVWAEPSENPYESPHYARLLTQEDLRKLTEEHRLIEQYNLGSGVYQKLMLPFAAWHLAFPPLDGRVQREFAEVMILCLATCYIATVTRPWVLYLRERMRDRISQGETEDPEVQREAQEFLARTGPHPGKVNICERVARASASRKLDMALDVTGIGVGGWFVVHYRPEIEDFWTWVQNELGAIGKKFGRGSL